MLGPVGSCRQGVVRCDVGSCLGCHLPLLLDPGELLQVGDAVQQSGKELQRDLLRVLRVDVALHHADHHFLWRDQDNDVTNC